MAIIRPFNALRPKSEYASKVASVPYDVVNTDEAAALAHYNNLSLLRVTRSEIEMPKGTNPYSPEVYALANSNLRKIASEAMQQDSSPYIYIYRLIMNGRTQSGLAATFAVDDYDNDIIKKHEKTRKEKEDDRTNHIVTTGAQTGPVFLTYKGSSIIDTLVTNTQQNEQPIYDFKAEDGIQHTLWMLPENKTETVVNAIGGIEALYIADGHHRAASASRARAAKKQNNTAHTGLEEYNFFIGVLFPAEQLQILPYNRVVKDLNSLNKDQFLKEAYEHFHIEASILAEPECAQDFAMYIDGKWWKMHPRDHVFASNALAGVSEKLDVSILQNFLLNPILGIDDPRTNKRIDFVGGIRGTGELEKLVDSGAFAVAFSLYPVSVTDLMNISDAGEIMPPKSTWFEPKLRDGLLIHLI